MIGTIFLIIFNLVQIYYNIAWEARYPTETKFCHVETID